MSWSIGFDERWKRDIGYGVPAYCDSPGCYAKIDRGLSYVCGGEPHGGDLGCGLYFCENHRTYHRFRGDAEGQEICARCAKHKPPYNPKHEHPEWLNHKATDPSWEEWRTEQAKTKAGGE